MLAHIEIENVSKSFYLHQQKNTQIQVLEDISLQIQANECVVLYGKSGLGKSTLLKCLYGNYLIEQGSIFLSFSGVKIDMANCHDQEKLAWRNSCIGYVSQFLNFVPRISSLDLVSQPLIDAGESKKVANNKAKQLLERLNIPEKLWYLSPSTFSGGEQQRVNLARGFIKPMPFLLLDEPTASLDQQNTDVVIDLIQDAKKQGSAILGIFHDEYVRNQVADKMYDLSLGEFV